MRYEFLNDSLLYEFEYNARNVSQHYYYYTCAMIAGAGETLAVWVFHCTAHVQSSRAIPLTASGVIGA